MSVIRICAVTGAANSKLGSRSGSTLQWMNWHRECLNGFIKARYGTALLVDDWAGELPAGVAHTAASGVHSTAVWDWTHFTILALMSLLTEFVRLLGKWKKLQFGKVHVFPSYALRQHIRVNLFGLDGWGKIGPG